MVLKKNDNVFLLRELLSYARFNVCKLLIHGELTGNVYYSVVKFLFRFN